MPDGSVDVSVLTPVLNEERHLRAARWSACAPRRSRGRWSSCSSTAGRPTRAARILASSPPRTRASACSTTPRGGPRTRSTSGCARRAARSSCGWTRTRTTRRTTWRPGVARLRRGGAVSVSGPQIAVGDGAGWSRRVALALQTPLGVGGASFRRAADEEFEVDTGFTGMWLRDDARARRRLGRGVADRPGLRARVPARGRRRPPRLRPGDGGGVHPARLAASGSPASTGSTASTRSRRSGATRRRCARRTCCRRRWWRPRRRRWPRRGPLRTVARAGLATYAAALAATAVAAARDGARPPTPPRSRSSTRRCTSPTASGCSPGCAATASRRRPSPAWRGGSRA